MTHDELIAKIEAYAAAKGIAPATVTSRAVGNSRLFKRLKGGHSCAMRTADRLVRYMADNPPPATSEEEDAA